MRVKQHSLGGLKGGTRRNSEKLPITPQLAALKQEGPGTEPPTWTSANPTLSQLQCYLAPHHTTLTARAAQ